MLQTFKNVFLCLKNYFTLANIVDPGEMHYC